MAGEIWAVCEHADGEPTRLGRELATLARALGAASGRRPASLLVGPGASQAAAALALHGPDVMALEIDPEGRPVAAVTAEQVAALARQRQPSFILVGASNDGRDVAGSLHALLEWGVLVNAAGVTWEEDGILVEMSVFGGRLVTRSAFVGEPGIVIVRPSAVTAEVAPAAGQVEQLPAAPAGELPPVRVVGGVAEASAAVSIEEAAVIVAGGRGVGGPEGFGIIAELADALGGAVGATRAVVDAGWIGYAHQIGQTGKSVKPSLYVAVGVSGAIQHKVGMQTSGTIVSINRDPDAPIVEFADLAVVGDLFEVVPRLTAAIRARRG